MCDDGRNNGVTGDPRRADAVSTFLRGKRQVVTPIVPEHHTPGRHIDRECEIGRHSYSQTGIQTEGVTPPDIQTGTGFRHPARWVTLAPRRLPSGIGGDPTPGATNRSAQRRHRSSGIESQRGSVDARLHRSVAAEQPVHHRNRYRLAPPRASRNDRNTIGTRVARERGGSATDTRGVAAISRRYSYCSAAKRMATCCKRPRGSYSKRGAS